jgi:hypothetical protein
VAGESNVVADMLSRPGPTAAAVLVAAVQNCAVGLDFSALVAAQSDCQDCAKMLAVNIYK